MGTIIFIEFWLKIGIFGIALNVAANIVLIFALPFGKLSSPHLGFSTQPPILATNILSISLPILKYHALF